DKGNFLDVAAEGLIMTLDATAHGFLQGEIAVGTAIALDHQGEQGFQVQRWSDALFAAETFELGEVVVRQETFAGNEMRWCRHRCRYGEIQRFYTTELIAPEGQDRSRVHYAAVVRHEFREIVRQIFGDGLILQQQGVARRELLPQTVQRRTVEHSVVHRGHHDDMIILESNDTVMNQRFSLQIVWPVNVGANLL